MSIFEVSSFIIGSFALGSFITLLSVLVGGLLVLRARSNGYEPVIPPLRAKEDEVAVNLPSEVDDGSNYPDIESILEERAKEFEKANASMLNQMKE